MCTEISSRELNDSESPVRIWIDDLENGVPVSNLAKWSLSSRQVREIYPDDVMRACIRYIGQSEDDNPVVREMAVWLSTNESYIPVLFDPEFFSLPQAQRAASVLKNADAKFFVRLTRLTGEKEREAESISRALAVLSGIGDYSVLIPWLRSLSRHTNKKIRSKAVKSLCGIRSNKSLIERQLQSEDPRVRANAIEAIWHAHNPDTVRLFRSALSDPHHRVVTNALVGLYYSEVLLALKMMIDLARHPSPMFRAAMAWALGHIGAPDGVAALKVLAEDSSRVVRTKALQVLSEFEARAASTMNDSKLDTIVKQEKIPTSEKGAPNETQATSHKVRGGSYYRILR